MSLELELQEVSSHPTCVLGTKFNGPIREQFTFLTSKPFFQPHLPFFFETGLTIFKAGLLCSPEWLIRLCFLSAMIKSVPHHNGSINWFLNDHPFPHSTQYNINLPNYIFFSLDFHQMLSNSETEVSANVTLGTNVKRAILLEIKADSQKYTKGVGMHICTHADI